MIAHIAILAAALILPADPPVDAPGDHWTEGVVSLDYSTCEWWISETNWVRDETGAWVLTQPGYWFVSTATEDECPRLPAPEPWSPEPVDAVVSSVPVDEVPVVEVFKVGIFDGLKVLP